MLEALHNFFDAFGTSVVVPVMIFIVSLCLKVNFQKRVYRLPKTFSELSALYGEQILLGQLPLTLIKN
ncbi:PTS system protein Galactitol-specific IIC component [Streptococcus criceti]|nr:PTS system protein Galactitol-specific IIC component [Streptococcus criceti]